MHATSLKTICTRLFRVFRANLTTLSGFVLETRTPIVLQHGEIRFDEIRLAFIATIEVPQKKKGDISTARDPMD